MRAPHRQRHSTLLKDGSRTSELSTAVELSALRPRARAASPLQLRTRCVERVRTSSGSEHRMYNDKWRMHARACSRTVVGCAWTGRGAAYQRSCIYSSMTRIEREPLELRLSTYPPSLRLVRRSRRPVPAHWLVRENAAAERGHARDGAAQPVHTHPLVRLQLSTQLGPQPHEVIASSRATGALTRHATWL